jgi:DNA-binding response OmpR family regulator
MMPEMDGLTLIQRVRDEVKSAPLILMIIAIIDDNSRQQVLEAGADVFFDKTIPIHQCGRLGFVRWACTPKLVCS